MTADRLSLVVPMHRSSSTLAPLLQRLSVTVPGSEVVLVDDACPECSADHAVAIDCHDLDIVIVRVVPNVGQHAAVQLGARHASGDVLVVMDADLQDAPEDVPTLVANLCASTKFDVVCAARSGRYTSPTRQLTARGYRAVVTYLTRGRIPRDAGMFLAVRAETFGRISTLGDPMAPLIPALAVSGARIKAITLQRHARLHGASGYTGSMRLRVALRGLAMVTPARWLVARRHRARFVGLAPVVSVERHASRRSSSKNTSDPSKTYRSEW